MYKLLINKLNNTIKIIISIYDYRKYLMLGVKFFNSVKKFKLSR